MTRRLLIRAIAAATCTLAGCMGPQLLSQDGPLLPATHGNAWGYIDQLGLVRISFHFTDAAPFSEGLAAIALGNQYGYIDREGTIVIPPRYDAAGAFKEGLAPVRRKETWTFITPEGMEIPAPPLSWANELHEGLAAVRDANQKWGYLDRSGKLVLATAFDRVEPFSEGVGCVHRDGKASFVDASGHPVPALGTWARGAKFSHGLAAVERDGRWGFIDRTGAVVVEPRFERVGEFAEGLAPAQEKEKFGFIDKTGRWAIEPRFDWAWTFSEGLACVTDARHKTGFIDPSGRVVIRPQFDEAESFSQGLARVRIDDLWSYVTKNGILVWTPTDYQEWDLIEEVSLERNPGLGFTERYVVSFRSDGTARFQGFDAGKRTGLFEGTLDRESFERLAKLIQSQGFFGMKEWYPVRADYPTAKLRVTRSGKTASVEADSLGGPTAWWGMVMTVDALTASVDWKRK